MPAELAVPSDWGLILCHVLPNSMGGLAVATTLATPNMTLGETSLCSQTWVLSTGGELGCVLGELAERSHRDDSSLASTVWHGGDDCGTGF
jgi:hypothetical protein